MWSGIIQATVVASPHLRRHTGLVCSFPVWRVSLASGPLARPCLVIFKQVIKQAYILQARAHSLLQALGKHIKNIKHIQALINCLKHKGDRCGHRARVLHCA